jgi:hypothetical protein
MGDIVRYLLSVVWDFVSLDEAKAAWAQFRADNGLSAVAVPILTMPDGNAKMEKTAKNAGVYVCGLALAPAVGSGYNTCRFKTPLCEAGCLTYAGQNAMPVQQRARIVKTLFLVDNPGAFYTLLFHEIGKAHRKYGDNLRIRLNMLSDIPWEDVLPEVFERFGYIRFYDYTKWTVGRRVTPPNYDLTYSASERTDDTWIAETVQAGEKVAVVMGIKRDEPMIATYHGLPVIDGDASDDRYLNAHGMVIGLRAKGKMRNGNYAGFVKEAIA